MRQLLWSVSIVAMGWLLPLQVAHAHVPFVQARTFCAEGAATVEWTVRSSNPSTGWEHHNVVVENLDRSRRLDPRRDRRADRGERLRLHRRDPLPAGADSVRVRTAALGAWSNGLVNEPYTYASNMTFYESEADNIAVPTDCVSYPTPAPARSATGRRTPRPGPSPQSRSAA